uniref:Uncharacterized protein n=1 Tax=Siphoviridae sp. ctRg61 TaxID=2826335 RepID=A0A8S5LUH7_9CAUD|nr:MAG TPA: hypothetical protein [Siphoviridae sp. ctRg61]
MPSCCRCSIWAGQRLRPPPPPHGTQITAQGR